MGYQEIGTVPKRTRILLVEDEFLIALGALSDLVAEGYEVDVRSDGAQGLAAFMSGHYDLVLTDFKMPKMNGIEMIAAIRQASVSVPIVLTSSFNEQALPSVPTAAYDAFLPKPYRTGDLYAVVQRLIRRVRSQSVGRPLATEAGALVW